jgi:hypothetical protein
MRLSDLSVIAPGEIDIIEQYARDERLDRFASTCR